MQSANESSKNFFGYESFENPSTKIFSFLKLCVLKEIANKINDNYISLLPESLKLTMKTLKNNYIKQTSDANKDIINILENTGNNLLNFSSFAENEVKPNQIDELINYLQLNERSEIKSIINQLSKYEYEIKLFNKEFNFAKRNSIFDLSCIGCYHLKS